MMDDFQLRTTNGKLDISLNLWGYFSMLFSQFQIGVSNIRNNVEAINIPNDPDAQSRARSQYANVLEYVNRHLDKELQKNGYMIGELSPNEAMSIFFAIRETITAGLNNNKLLASEMTYLNNGFTGFLNQLMGTGMNVDEVVKYVSELPDEELVKKICEEVTLRAIRKKLIH